MTWRVNLRAQKQLAQTSLSNTFLECLWQALEIFFRSELFASHSQNANSCS